MNILVKATIFNKNKADDQTAEDVHLEATHFYRLVTAATDQDAEDCLRDAWDADQIAEKTDGVELLQVTALPTMVA